jgi:hypothetical protein
MRIRFASIVIAAFAIVAGGVAGAGCSSSDRGQRGDGGARDLGGGGGGDLGMLPVDECSDAAKLIYLVDQNATLFSFAPNQMDITQSALVSVGSLSCPAGTGARPFSMSVDRSGTAWVHYVLQSPFGGAGTPKIFKVSTQNAACMSTNFALSNGFEQFGMGFASDVVNGSTETLYIAGGASSTGATAYLGKIDTSTLMTSRIAQVAGNPELTGTGDAKLWGFFPDSFSPRIAEISRSNAGESNEIPLPELAGDPAAWAFAFWGGDFWVFLQRTSETSTRVYRVTRSGMVTSYPLPGRTIVGAGVSTCAPTTPIN